MEAVKQVYFSTRTAWRNWLKKNYLSKRKIAVIVYKKHTGKHSPNHRELMEEAICFGWIDTTIKRLDHKKYLRYFVRRNNNGKWSKNTLRYAGDLMKKGKMSAEGIKRYKEGLARTPHDEGIPKNPRVPKYLREEIEKESVAKENFRKIPPSYKRTLLRWLLRAKFWETKKKRVRIIIQSLKKNEKLFPAA
jgi:uncharacterized protein YdeI (YjbR/CyaY-like superfamily)